MIKLEFNKKNCLHDAAYDQRDRSSVTLCGSSFEIEFKKLKSLSLYQSTSTDDDLSLITQTLSTDVIDLGGIKAFKGTENGTNLAYITAEDIDGRYLLVFSQGETQPGREVCYFEAAFRYE